MTRPPHLPGLRTAGLLGCCRASGKPALRSSVDDQESVFDQFSGLIRLGWTRGGSPGIFG